MTLLAFNWDFDLGCIIAFFSLIIAAVSFLKTRKLEKQQFKLNEYALAEKKREIEELKHASVKLEPVSKINSHYMTVRIINNGKCDARQIKVTFLNDIIKQYPDAIAFEETPPEFLKANDHVVVGLTCSCHDTYANYIVNWVDDAGEQTYEGSFLISRNLFK